MFDYFLRPEKVSIFAREIPVTDDTIIVPCAFGRNTWDDAEVSQQLLIIMMGAEEKLSDIEMFKRLMAEGFDAGSVNRALASICYQLAGNPNSLVGYMDRYHPCRIVGQWEVMYELWLQQPDWYERNSGFFLFTIWPDPQGEYLSTRGLLEACSYYREDIILIAQAVHMARCLRVADQVFGHDSVSKASGAMPNLYDEASVQPWTRNQTSFVAWEKKARIFEELPSWLRSLVRRFL